MIIKDIKWLSKEACEAIVLVGSENVECSAFYHPCLVDIGYKINEPLLALETKNIMKVDNSETSILQRSNPLDSEIIAKIISVSKKLVCINSINIELDSPLPGGVIENDYVKFTCMRLDVIG